MTYPPPDLSFPDFAFNCPELSSQLPGMQQQLSGLSQRGTAKLENLSETLHRYHSYAEERFELDALRYALTIHISDDLDHVASLLITLVKHRDSIEDLTSEHGQSQSNCEAIANEARLYLPDMDAFINDASEELDSIDQGARELLEQLPD